MCRPIYWLTKRVCLLLALDGSGVSDLAKGRCLRISR